MLAQDSRTPWGLDSEAVQNIRAQGTGMELGLLREQYIQGVPAQISCPASPLCALCEMPCDLGHLGHLLKSGPQLGQLQQQRAEPEELRGGGRGEGGLNLVDSGTVGPPRKRRRGIECG